jgi:hypothetical protein
MDILKQCWILLAHGIGAVRNHVAGEGLTSGRRNGVARMQAHGVVMRAEMYLLGGPR